MQVQFTSYGPAALILLRQAVAAAKAHDPMAPVTLIVPTNLAGIVARRYLAAGVGDGRIGIAALDITTLDRLAERLAAPNLAPRRPVTAPVLAAAWRTALATEPGVFAEVADHPATVQALAAAHRTLRDADNSALTGVEKLGGLPAEVVRLHRTVRHSLHSDWYDGVDLLDDAATRCHGADLGAVVLYLPQELSRAQAALADGLLRDRPASTVICGLTGVRRADAALTPWLEQLEVQLPDPPAPSTATRLLNASDSDDEVRCVVREVVEALKHTPAHRVAVLYSATRPYARLLHEQLAAAGVTVNGTGPRPVGERAIAQCLLGLLALPEGDLARADLFRTLASAPVRDFDGQRVPLSRWERTSRSAGVVRGEDWSARLCRLVDVEQAEIASEMASEDPQDWRLERSRQAIESAEGLNAFVARLRSELDSAERMSTWRDLTGWAGRLYETLLGSPGTLNRLPAEEQYAAAAVASTLQALGNLDAVEGAASLTRLREALELALASSLPRVGRFGDGIYVGPLSSAVGLDLEVSFVLGLSEDLYPGRVHEDALLPEKVRAATNGQVPSARAALDRQHRNLLAAFASAPTVVASFPRGDLRRSTVRIPSRFLLPTLRHLSGDHRLPATAWQPADYAGAMATSGSFAGELLQTRALSQEQEWRTRQAAAVHTLDDATVRAGTVMVRARAQHALSRFDGNLSGLEGIPDYAMSTQAISPTALEFYAACPYAFFVRRLLGVQPLEQPEDIVVVSPTQIGTFVHAVVDRLIRECQDELPGFGEPWTGAQRERLRAIAESEAEALAQQGLTGHPRLWQRERQRILGDLEWMLDDDDAWHAREQSRVMASEMAFGMRGGEAVAVTVSRGSVSMRGSADRVDQRADGTLVVTDIKTGSRTAFDKISESDPYVEGTKLQLPVYALAARSRFGNAGTPVRAAYWFVRKGRGRKELPLTQEVEQSYAVTVGVLVDSIAAGLFPPKAPETPDFLWVQCSYCNPDGTGYGDLREVWERKQFDPLLQRLVRLIDVDAPASLGDAGAAQ
ncbi:PD-(D/E)XK nuclease superfamily protein [Friedmanniella luteola]|uniref:PD-(D/E)XK nuclease superfamily protein n=1 Tax=Friedmanniella luteola TaxID=546871 RepID=A0A1H1ZN34_9ACTN|nr:PD-(D/E)XK nuclease family protein [Friedmanniella luteola]SDT34636.1 PD-(D/E)XK nuclease superfamily protein [Friedmanniella luteola]